jgi:ELWxxDGT repeat protein
MPYTSFRSSPRRPSKSSAPHVASLALPAFEALEDRSLPSATMVTQFGPADPLTDYGSGVAFQNDLYFTATVGQTTGLYKSNGTAAGTVLVKTLAGGPNQFDAQFTVVNNALFFD